MGHCRRVENYVTYITYSDYKSTPSYRSRRLRQIASTFISNDRKCTISILCVHIRFTIGNHYIIIGRVPRLFLCGQSRFLFKYKGESESLTCPARTEALLITHILYNYLVVSGVKSPLSHHPRGPCGDEDGPQR